MANTETASLEWRWRTFDRLTPHELYAVLALRQRVFAVEQNCVYLDADGLDTDAHHLLGIQGSAVLVAYLRLLPSGLRYSEPSLGRVVTAPEARRTGLGRAMMAEGIRYSELLYPGHGIRIMAQQYLEAFYQSFGFRTVSDPFDEDGIPHLEMLRP
ncbi:MAG: GNAT family N-acetyltransferase [Armatimonadaceae bacterium]